MLTKNAKVSGIREGDRIIALEDKKIKDSQSFIKEINKYKVGQTVHITIERNGKQVKIPVELSDKNEME